MKALFEKIYRECEVSYEGASNGPFNALDNTADGISDKHNPPLSRGSTGQVRQSGARKGDNKKLFEMIYQKSLKEANFKKFDFIRRGTEEIVDEIERICFSEGYDFDNYHKAMDRLARWIDYKFDGKADATDFKTVKRLVLGACDKNARDVFEEILENLEMDYS